MSDDRNLDSDNAWDATGSWAPLPAEDEPDPFDPLPPPVPSRYANLSTDIGLSNENGREVEVSSAAEASGNAGGEQRRRAADYEYFPPRRRGRALLGFLVTLALLAGGVLFAVKWYKAQVDPAGLPGQQVEINIPSDTASASIGKILHTQGVIGNATLFTYWTKAQGKGGFEAGKYQFRKNSSFTSALDVLLKGPEVPDQNKVTFPEGYRIEQIADRLQEKLSGRTAAKFIEAVKSDKVRSTFEPADIHSLEGFLYPDTYTFGLNDDESSVASRMVDRFDQVADQLGLADSQNLVGVTPYQTLIIASLVEREAKLDADRAKIARVIYNRLKSDTPLQIDAALIYALNNHTTRLLTEDLKLDSPYNTYLNKGLPPGPIANPGSESIKAALHPEVGDWMYYVVTGPNGESSFAVTYRDHLKNIKLAKQRGLR